MSPDPASFLASLRRRRVWRVGAGYGAAALATALAVSELYAPLGLPDGTPRVTIVVLALGFPVALVLSWAFEPKVERAASATAPETREHRKSIVVLPFDNMSPDPGDAYFADGLTEEVITQLSHLRPLRVISRNSAMVLKGTRKDTRSIGRELAVQYVMEGSVRKAGDSLRITAQLIDARTDEHLWAETYARELQDVFEVQAEIAMSVAGALDAELSPAQEDRLKRPPTTSLDARDAFLLARHHFAEASEAGMSKAKDFFDQALGIDPEYAQAHAVLSYWYFQAGAAWSLMPAGEALPLAKSTAERAIELDGELGDAYGTLATVQGLFYWDWADARRTAALGVEKDPNSYLAWVGYSNVMNALGERAECLRAVERYVELDPLSVLTRGYAASQCSVSGDLDRALEHALLCEKLDPGIWGALNVWMVLDLAGRPDDGFAHLLEVEDQWDAIRRGNGACLLAYALGRQRRHAEFEETVAGLERRARAGTATWTELALAYMGVDDHERALSYLEKAPDQRPPGGDMTAWIGVFPWFDPLRDDPRFQRVLERIGLG